MEMARAWGENTRQGCGNVAEKEPPKGEVVMTEFVNAYADEIIWTVFLSILWIVVVLGLLLLALQARMIETDSSFRAASIIVLAIIAVHVIGMMSITLFKGQSIKEAEIIQRDRFTADCRSGGGTVTQENKGKLICAYLR